MSIQNCVGGGDASEQTTRKYFSCLHFVLDKKHDCVYIVIKRRI
jgi:hypothetical protein